MRKSSSGFVLVPLLCIAQPAFALQCSSPTLKGASGVIGNKHSYKVTGDCSYSWSETESSLGSSTTKNYGLAFAYVGSASWDRQTGEATEKLTLTGDSTFELDETLTMTLTGAVNEHNARYIKAKLERAGHLPGDA